MIGNPKPKTLDREFVQNEFDKLMNVIEEKLKIFGAYDGQFKEETKGILTAYHSCRSHVQHAMHNLGLERK